jgi:hypothetical protein
MKLIKSSIAVLLLMLILSTKSYAQKRINLRTDTVATYDAKTAKKEFRKLYRRKEDVRARLVSFDVATLKQLLDSCHAKGISKIDFQFSIIRKEDTARYASRNPGLTAAERNQLLNQPTLLVKVNRLVLNGQFNSSAGRTSSGRQSIPGALRSALYNIGNAATSTSEVYFELGTICPPPQTCYADDFEDDPQP